LVGQVALPQFISVVLSSPCTAHALFLNASFRSVNANLITLHTGTVEALQT
jgi:hypothetical protein